MFSLRQLRNPPTAGELQTLNRQMLLELASKSGERFPRNGSKAVLADLVIFHWRSIIQSYANGGGMRSVFQNEDFDLAHQMYEDPDDETNSDTSSINPPTMFEYHGQPHRQEPLPQGWNTPRSVSTEGVLNSSEPEHFSSDVSDTASELMDDFGGLPPLVVLGDEKKLFTIDVYVPKKDGMMMLKYHYGNQTTGLDLITEFSSLCETRD